MLVINSSILIQPPKIFYENTKINIIDKCVFYGVSINIELKFDNHINQNSKNDSKFIGILYKLHLIVPKNILTNIYYLLVYPYSNYCNIIWGYSYHIHSQPVLLMQKKIIRILNNAPSLTHTDPIFFSCNILKLNDIFSYSLHISVFKNLSQFQNLSTYGYNTRHCNDIRSDCRRTAVVSGRSSSVIGPIT